MEFAPNVALAIFFTKLVDPFAILPAVVVGYFSRTWWQVVISAAAVGIAVEIVLVLFQQTPGVHEGRFLMGVLAAGVWCNLGFAFKIWRVKRARKTGES
jgi:peptidoglycan biosynthesis protein MviN/MurJ (putative lipid II flippase)